jgi:hypothetical protein
MGYIQVDHAEMQKMMRLLGGSGLTLKPLHVLINIWYVAGAMSCRHSSELP